MNNTKLITIDPANPDPADIAIAAKLLRNGKLVAIPTETVYGLAADATNPDAVKNIFLAKGRPQDNPLIVHISSLDEIYPLVTDLPETAKKLAARFWPGPLTMILPKSEKIPNITSGGLNSVAIRMPSHPVAKAIIKASGVPIAAPSANLSGSPSPTTAQHCIDDLTGRVDAIVDGGNCAFGVESTVISLLEQEVRLLRPGAVTLEQLTEVVGQVKVDSGVVNMLGEGETVLSPGMKYKHYAPKAKVILLKGEEKAFAAYVNENAKDAAALCFEQEKTLLCCPCISYGEKFEHEKQAQMLFAALRSFDEMGVGTVYVHCPAVDGMGLAVYNRLLRAAAFDVRTL